MIFALPFFLAAAAWVGATRPGTGSPGAMSGAIVFLGFIGYYFASFVRFLGLQYVSAGLGRLILFLYPTLVVVLVDSFPAQASEHPRDRRTRNYLLRRCAW